MYPKTLDSRFKQKRNLTQSSTARGPESLVFRLADGQPCVTATVVVTTTVNGPLRPIRPASPCPAVDSLISFETGPLQDSLKTEILRHTSSSSSKTPVPSE